MDKRIEVYLGNSMKHIHLRDGIAYRITDFEIEKHHPNIFTRVHVQFDTITTVAGKGAVGFEAGKVLTITIDTPDSLQAVKFSVNNYISKNSDSIRKKYWTKLVKDLKYITRKQLN